MQTRVVAHTGFEPVISALRGRCPWPLDECATQGQFHSGWGSRIRTSAYRSRICRPTTRRIPNWLFILPTGGGCIKSIWVSRCGPPLLSPTPPSGPGSSVRVSGWPLEDLQQPFQRGYFVVRCDTQIPWSPVPVDPDAPNAYSSGAHNVLFRGVAHVQKLLY